MGSVVEILKRYSIPIASQNEQQIFSKEDEGKSLIITNGYNFEKSLNCDQNWKNYMQSLLAYIERLDKTEQDEVLSKIDFQDWHWDWGKKTMSTKADNHYEWFYLEIDNSVEAACLIFFPKESILNPNESIFYIEYIAVAPWNRYTPLGAKRYTGLGGLLLVQAIKFLARKYQHTGRFCLHSLPQAEGFYLSKLQMQHLALGDKTELKYFEMTEDVLELFLGEVA